MIDVYDILRDYMIRPKGMFIWRDIPGYKGSYQISNHGEVRVIREKMLSENDTQIVLIGKDKSRYSINRYKLLNAYWKESERYKGDERWQRLDSHPNYSISNYANLKTCKSLVLWPKNGLVVLTNAEGERSALSVIKLFLNTFPDELFIDHEKKEVNYMKND